MNPLHEQFIVEARELIQQANDDLMAAEREGFSDEQIDRVFRVFHTLKGSAAVVDLPPLGLILHAGEDVLAAIHTGSFGATSAVIEGALTCLDQAGKWVDDFEAHEALPAKAGEVARRLAEELRNTVGGSAALGPKLGAVERQGRGVPDWARRLIDTTRLNVAAHGSSRQLFAISYEPNVGCFFDGDDPLELMRRTPKLVAFYLVPREGQRPFSDLDPFSCNLRLFAISAATDVELAAVFRLVPDQVRVVELPVDLLPLAPQLGGGDQDAITLVRAIIDEQVQVLRISRGPENYAGCAGSAVRAVANALRYSGHENWIEKIERAGAAAKSQSSPDALLAIFHEMRDALQSPPALVDAESEVIEASGQSGSSAVARSLRVAEARIDVLVDLAGELLVVKNGFAHLTRRLEADLSHHDLARAIRGQNDTLERLAGELHGAVLQLRMVPMSQVFRSFPRLVRDMSRQLGKDVTLVTRGETTESDKTIADLLFEPLMHLVRNAMDHGIETAEQRSAARKPASSTISLNAARVGDRIVVEVTDDGGGIDPELIRRKASEKGLMSNDELDALSDEQILDLIFAAGFSTASKVSDISGRGVGMDVVRATTERIGGRVSLKSRVGAGTTVSLDLPTNIALLRIMVVESGSQLFGLPMDSVSETMRLTPDRISRFKNNDGFVLHDRVVPICSLAELMNLPARGTPQTETRTVVVSEIGGKTAALEVDGIRDRLEVVLKPMQGLLANARGYAGTTLLGDGSVLLVLDLKEILP
jgi:two-component system, chemotaxis family, sensor kinase CheA